MYSGVASISCKSSDKVHTIDFSSVNRQRSGIHQADLMSSNSDPAESEVSKRKPSNKKKGKKSEVYPFSVEDAKMLADYFKKNGMWHHYLIFVMSCNTARRIGDMLRLKWEDVYDPKTGEIRENLKEFNEEKTDKLANPRINPACVAAINLFVEKTECSPSADNYSRDVFMQYSGTHKGNTISADGYRKALKKAAVAVGIKYNVGTHSARKSFGMWSRMLHPGDYDSMELLQTIYNHSDTKTTKHYIGLTKQKVDAYYDDMGEFFNDYITGDKQYIDVSHAPVVSLDTNDLRDIIRAAYESGSNNSGSTDPMVHVDAINSIMSMIESLSK